jgi:hypothetical protein
MLNVFHHGGPTGNPIPLVMQPDGPTIPPVNPFPFPGNNDPMMVYKQTICIDINHPSTDTTAFPIKALLKELLMEMQKVHPTAMILPTDEHSMAGALTMDRTSRVVQPWHHTLGDSRTPLVRSTGPLK